MEEEHIDRFSDGGVDDSRDARSKYSGDPLFLQNLDNPGMTLVSSVLTGNNYLAWSRSIEITLGAKVKLGFINENVIAITKTHQITNKGSCQLYGDFVDFKFHC